MLSSHETQRANHEILGESSPEVVVVTGRVVVVLSFFVLMKARVQLQIFS
jgi:hypothetical protein